MRSRVFASWVSAVAALAAGCSLYLDDADRQVSRMIHTAQSTALGEVHPADLGKETAKLGPKGNMYDFNPHPVDSDVPESFLEERKADDETMTGGAEGVDPLPAASSQPAAGREILTLNDAFRYAMYNARSFQSAKEDLYLSALALSLERFLWTPRFSGDIVTRYTNYGQVRDFDQAMSAVSQVAVEQRLPYGGTVTARVLNEWVRDLGAHVTVGETGQAILEADIPLLRGAGRAAYETRYQAERNLIYATRTFERFRRDFLVQIAGEYFNLLSIKSRVQSAIDSEASFKEDMERSAALAATGRVLQVEADRTRVEYFSAQNRTVIEQANYDSALDRFKILLAIATEKPVDISEDVEIPLYEPNVVEPEAIATAHQYRLDLLNDLDLIDDARRGVAIAKNNMLPDLNFNGSVAMDTDPAQKNSTSYNDERTTWRGVLTAEIPFDRMAERNDLRASVIDLRRAERRYDQSKDTVSLEVRQALRRLHATRVTMVLQQKNIEINETRKELARLQFEKGQLRSNRDVVEAENDWRNAVNAYAQALADYRLAILEFLRDTGTLRVNDEGQWIDPRGLAAAADPV